MQTQTQKTGELMGEIRGHIVSRSIKDITPLGVRLELINEAQFVGGKYTATHLETVNMFQKVDGTLEWESKAIETTVEGDFVAINGRGNGKVTGPTSLWAEGEFAYMTKSPKLSWLNGTKSRLEVDANMKTGEFELKVYSQ
ncbi:MAG TPA: hypothetical protein VN739_00320 [Nitrososphaerales archaeon]|nr:hypothetical protein [Nitrososphaerales archaeon]